MKEIYTDFPDLSEKKIRAIENHCRKSHDTAIADSVIGAFRTSAQFLQRLAQKPEKTTIS